MAHLCNACGRGFEQQVPRRSLSGKAASSVRSQFACYFVRSQWLLKNVKHLCATYSNNNVVIKERKARLQEFLQKLQTRILQCPQTLSSLRKGRQRQTRANLESRDVRRRSDEGRLEKQ